MPTILLDSDCLSTPQNGSFWETNREIIFRCIFLVQNAHGHPPTAHIHRMELIGPVYAPQKRLDENVALVWISSQKFEAGRPPKTPILAVLHFWPYFRVKIMTTPPMWACRLLAQFNIGEKCS